MSPENRRHPDAAPAYIGPEPIRATPTEQPVFNLQNERQAQALALLESGLEQTLTEAGYEQWLAIRAKFHRYSVPNSLLIMAQMPEATLVNAKDRWQALGRTIKPEERYRGIKVFFPYKQLREVENDETGETERRIVVTGFGIGNTFDVSQTEGRDLPPPPVLNFTEYPGQNEVSVELNRRLATYLIGREVRCESLPLDGAAMGLYNPVDQRVVIRRPEEGTPALSIQKTRTLAHETAHHLTDHLDRLSRDEAETVAESCAYVTMAHYGLPTDGYSFSYIASYAQDKRVFRDHLQTIQTISNQLIAGVEGEKPEEADTWL